MKFPRYQAQFSRTKTECEHRGSRGLSTHQVEEHAQAQPCKGFVDARNVSNGRKTVQHLGWRTKVRKTQSPSENYQCGLWGGTIPPCGRYPVNCWMLSILAVLECHRNPGSTSKSLSISTLLPLGKHKSNSVILLLLRLRKDLASEKHLYPMHVFPNTFCCNFTDIKMIISTLYNHYLSTAFQNIISQILF